MDCKITHYYRNHIRAHEESNVKNTLNYQSVKY